MDRGVSVLHNGRVDERLGEEVMQTKKGVEELKMTNGVLRVLIKKFKIKIFLLKNEKLLLMICFILSYDL